MIQGSCHCGAVSWTLERVPESATACICTLCRRYGALWAHDYENEGIEVSGPTGEYVRGRQIGFHFCQRCGCVAYARWLAAGEDERRRIAVNLPTRRPGDRLHHRNRSLRWTPQLRGSASRRTAHADMWF